MRPNNSAVPMPIARAELPSSIAVDLFIVTKLSPFIALLSICSDQRESGDKVPTAGSLIRVAR